jgi:hypothetical protein
MALENLCSSLGSSCSHWNCDSPSCVFCQALPFVRTAHASSSNAGWLCSVKCRNCARGFRQTISPLALLPQLHAAHLRMESCLDDLSPVYDYQVCNGAAQTICRCTATQLLAGARLSAPLKQTSSIKQTARFIFAIPDWSTPCGAGSWGGPL